MLLGLAALFLAGFVLYEILFMNARFPLIRPPQDSVSIVLIPMANRMGARITNKTSRTIHYQQGRDGSLGPLVFRLERSVLGLWWRNVYRGVLVMSLYIGSPPLAAGASREHLVDDDPHLPPGHYRGCLTYTHGQRQAERCSAPVVWPPRAE